MKNQVLTSLLLIFSAVHALASDEFTKFNCTQDPAKSLVGKRISAKKVSQTEQLHKNIGLKHVWSDGMPEDAYNLISWEFCDNQYIFLAKIKAKKAFIADILKIKKTEAQLPQSLPGADCEQNGKKINFSLVALLNPGSQEIKTAARAWKIDPKRFNFSTIPTSGLTCKN